MINTRNKRASAVGLTPWTVTLPAPDGTLDRGDRRQLAFTYRGDSEVTGAHAHGELSWHLPHVATLEQT